MAVIQSSFPRAFAAANAEPSARAAFIRRTYGHLAGAIAAFVVLEYALLQTTLPRTMVEFLMRMPYGWLLFLGAFILVGWMASSLAANAESRQTQYLGLGLYVVAEGILFAPLLFIAVHFSSPEVLPMAAMVTGLLFAGLTAVVFVTRNDFSFLRGILMIGGFVALGLILAGTFFGFRLGLAFSGGMILLASGAILYDTSKVLHHYSTDQHVAAALELFASVALLFWYVLRLFMQLNRQ